ncbi:RteC domain-containing protein [Psychroflexus sp. ALD_RP9]|uniref:RteC domain-containing protein n=1 Tax=Psychroflexus sp. ALD_RP9 TaxID=2777186 RepID=UPI001A8C2BB8|nr:RteC domain-containing protein [Psychroflexus sp. ALD_RP9]QSS96282.1 RteC domain-containing protein [Psychroflexus sp. ALD_RP9]
MKYKSVMDNFYAELSKVESRNEDIIRRSETIIEISKQHLYRLKSLYYSDTDKSKDLQIRFFKELKPVIAKTIFYYTKIRCLEFSLNEVSIDKADKIITKSFKKIDKFLDKHMEFIYNLKHNEEKATFTYFTTKQELASPVKLFKENPYHDISDCYYSDIYAEYQAYIEFKSYLDNRNKKKTLQHIDLNRLWRKQAWTATSTDFIELVYALYHSNSINNGQVTIKEIVQSLEAAFEVKLPKDYYKTIDDIKQRKEVAKFINRLEFSLINNT